MMDFLSVGNLSDGLFKCQCMSRYRLTTHGWEMTCDLEMREDDKPEFHSSTVYEQILFLFSTLLTLYKF